MTLDGETCAALWYGNVPDLAGMHTWRVEHRDRAERPRLVSHAESQRRYRASRGEAGKAADAARKRAARRAAKVAA